MPESFLPLIEDRIAQLRAHPDVHVISAVVVPADSEALSKAVERLGWPFDPSLEQFYRECNGLRMSWTYRGHAGFETLREVVETGFSYPGYKPYAGSICILPVQDFLSTDAADFLVDSIDPPGSVVELDGGSVSFRELAATLRQFSLRSCEDSEGLFRLPGGGHLLACSQDQGTAWAGVPGLGFADYLRFVLGNFGAEPLQPPPLDDLQLWRLTGDELAAMRTIRSLDEQLERLRSAT